MASEAEQVQAIQAENEALTAEIKALKKTLGIDKVEEANERKRIQGLFTLYDVDGSGFIEKDEFQGLAVIMGLVLTPDAVAKAMTAAGAVDGKINFEQFHTWVTNVDHGEVSSDIQEKDLLALKLKLGTTSFLKAAAGMTRAMSKRVGENPVDYGKEYFNVRVGTQTVGMKDPHFRLALNWSNDAAKASALRAAANAEDAGALIVVDLATSADATDESVGELAGAVSPLLDMACSQLPLPFPISHEEMFVSNEAGEKVFRLVFKLGMNPLEMVQGMIGFDPSVLLKELSVVVELAASISDVFGPNFDALEAVAHHVAVGVSVDKALVDTVSHFLAQQGAPDEVTINMLGAKALSDVEFQVKTFNLAEAARSNQVIGMYAGAIGQQAPMYIQMAQQQLSMLPQMIPPEFHGLYSGVRKNILGPRRIAVSAGNAQVYIDLKGLDAIPILPTL